MHALIIGAGIGGPLAAIALQQMGVEATVYEAHAGPAESRGLFLGLGINGMRVLRQLGLLDAVLRADPIPTPTMAFRSSTGKRLGSVAQGWLDGQTPSITMMRGALQRVLAEEAQARGIAIHYGARFTSCTERAGQVAAHFAAGDTAEGDLLIGADGIHSRVRATIAPEAPPPQYTGLLNIGGIARGTALPATPGTMEMVWGRRAFFGYTIRPGGEAWWFANLGQRAEPGRDELSALTTADWRRRLHPLFDADPPFIRSLIDQTDTIEATPIHDLPTTPRWHRGRVGLMGDAAHAVSPSSGQGASLAMEDALMLARCLGEAPAPQQALAHYEQLRRPRAERMVAEGRRRGSYKALEHDAAVFLRDLVMPLALRLFASKRATAWIADYEIPWEAPAPSSAA